MKQRTQDSKINNQIVSAKLASKSSDQSQFFNRTGPIKLMHNNKFNGNVNLSQNQSQHVEDMFNMIDEVQPVEVDARSKPKQGFHNTQ